MSTRLFFLFSLSIIPIYSLTELKKFSTACRDSAGLRCICTLTLLPIQNEPPVITLTGCHRAGGWSEWASWSQCRRNIQKRRRRCDRPTPYGRGSFCRGTGIEKRTCASNSTYSIPEYIWGVWSSWNAWEECKCGREYRKRTRHCLGGSCEGCHVELAKCQVGCRTVRKWTDWTAWMRSEGAEHRFRGLAVGSANDNMTVELREERRETQAPAAPWSDWEVRAGVAFRHKLAAYRQPLIEHQLISTTPTRSVHVKWMVLSSFTSLLLGFWARSVISCCFRRKRQKFQSVSSFSGQDFTKPVV